MSGRGRAALATLAVVFVLALGGCTWFDDGAPDRSCRSDRDCFRAQGEVCDQDRHTCVVPDGADAGVGP